MSDSTIDPLQLQHQDAIVKIVEGRSDIDRRMLRWSDWLNPILVKETRQALKSRQFSITFGLLMVAIVGWTMLGISMLLPGIYYYAAGPALLYGYFLILLVPVGLVVPNAAYRSMAAELEEGTFEVLSISSLSARQIVVGKLCVAMLQTIVYFSALAPCIALTYLLRGIGLPVLVYILLSTFMISLALSTLAIFFATLSRSRAMQVLFTLLLFVCIIPSCFAWTMGVTEALSEQMYPQDLPEWGIYGLVIGFGLSYVLLGVLAATAKVGLATENYSTRLRYVMWLQHAAAVILFIYLCSELGVRSEPLMALEIILFIHWAIMGTLMIGESGVVSPRAQRRLPYSALGRTFLTWFNPGGGPGYVFTITSFGSVWLFLVAMQAIPWRLSSADQGEHLVYGWALWCYLALYLGLARLFIVFLGKRTSQKMLLAFVVVAFLAIFGALIPLMISFWMNGFREPTYEFFMFTNLIWTLWEIADARTAYRFDALILLSISAAIVAFINLLTISRDVTLMRIETPERVRKELGVKETQVVEEVIDPLAEGT